MDRRRLKTLLIALLLTADVFLLALWVFRAARAQSEADSHYRQLSARLAENGLDIGGAALPESRARVLEFARDHEAEAAAARVLLGRNAERGDAGGGIIDYTGEGSLARFRNLGEFAVTLARPLPLSGSLAALAASMGFAGEEREEGLYAALVAGLPVWGCEARFEVKDGMVTGVAGAWPFGYAAAESLAQSRSAASALVVLSQSLAEPDRLVDMELGYRPDMAAPGYMRLVPCWKITLASGVRYADAV